MVEGREDVAEHSRLSAFGGLYLLSALPDSVDDIPSAILSVFDFRHPRLPEKGNSDDSYEEVVGGSWYASPDKGLVIPSCLAGREEQVVIRSDDTDGCAADIDAPRAT